MNAFYISLLTMKPSIAFGTVYILSAVEVNSARRNSKKLNWAIS
jgi:hypothetical protein